MSDTGSPDAAGTGASSRFTDREIQLLGWAMQSLKGGAAPDVRATSHPYQASSISLTHSD
jgi:hypothetical protein